MTESNHARTFMSLLIDGTRYSEDDCQPLARLASLVDVITFRPGDYLMREGETGQSAYLLIDGDVTVTRDQDNKTLGHLSRGNILGEMALTGNRQRAASVIATTPVAAYRIAREEYQNALQVFPELPQLVAEKTYQQLARKHQELSERHEQLKQLQQQKKSLTYLFITMMLLLSGYSLLNSFMLQVLALPGDSTAMFAFSRLTELIGLLIIIQLVRQSDLTMHDMGLRLGGAWRSVKEAMLLTLPAMAVLYGLAVYLGRENSDLELGLDFSRLDWTYYSYLLIAPVQEWIARGVFQTGIEKLIDHRRRGLLAVLIASLVFATLHLHLNPTLALVSLISGLIWGGLFIRHRNLVGVSVSHFLLGNWVALLGLWALWT